MDKLTFIRQYPIIKLVCMYLCIHQTVIIKLYIIELHSVT